jgi:hypothetical protein
MSVAATSAKPIAQRSTKPSDQVAQRTEQLQQRQQLGDVSARTGEVQGRIGGRGQGFDGYEVSDPRQRLPIDRADAPTPTGEPKLSAEVSALRVVRSGRTQGAGNGQNHTANSLRSGTGRIPRGDWDHPERIVGRLTQTPGPGETGNSAYRCGPSNVLAASLMNGPASGARLLDRVATGADGRQLTDGQRQELRGIAGRVRGRTATFEDLSRAQSLLYRAGNTESTAAGLANTLAGSQRLTASQRGQAQRIVNAMGNNAALTPQQVQTLERLGTRHYGQPTRLSVLTDEHQPHDRSRDYWGVSVGGKSSSTDRSGFNDREMANLGGLGGGQATTSGPQINYGVARPMEDLVSRLRPGQSATVRVHHEHVGGDNEFTARPDHFVTVGRRADGTAYLYNSDPSRGDHTLFTGRPGADQPQNFRDELSRYDNRLTYDGDNDTPHTLTQTW